MSDYATRAQWARFLEPWRAGSTTCVARTQCYAALTSLADLWRVDDAYDRARAERAFLERGAAHFVVWWVTEVTLRRVTSRWWILAGAVGMAVSREVGRS